MRALRVPGYPKIVVPVLRRGARVTRGGIGESGSDPDSPCFGAGEVYRPSSSPEDSDSSVCVDTSRRDRICLVSDGPGRESWVVVAEGDFRRPTHVSWPDVLGIRCVPEKVEVHHNVVAGPEAAGVSM